MGYPKLWICFHSRDKNDLWALHLDNKHDADCDIWHISGQTYEFEHTHVRNTRPEDMTDFKTKWLVKEDLTDSEIVIVKDIAGNHPVDNEASYWDCRIFCFEILASLENEGVLNRSDHAYRKMRRMLHVKWKSDDGVPVQDSEDMDSEDENDAAAEDSSLTGAGSPEIPSTANGGHESNEDDVGAGRKRALSHSSHDNATVDSNNNNVTTTQLDTSNLKPTKRIKGQIPQPATPEKSIYQTVASSQTE